MDKFKALFKNKKFVVSMVAVAALVAAELGINLSSAVQEAIALLILTLAGA